MPLSIVQPLNPNEDQRSFLIIKAYPICHEWYHYHNIIVASCGHTYHCFCLFNHLEGSTKYVMEFCHSRVLHHDWWVSMGISPLTTKQTVHFEEMGLSRQRQDFVEHKRTTFRVATSIAYKTCFFLHSSYTFLA